jgi:uncharacterized protein (DUF2141 family)
MTQDESRSIDLEDTFILYDDSPKQYTLKLSPASLSITAQQDENANRSLSINDTRLVPIDDIYGCLCMKSNKDSNQCHLTLYLNVLRAPQGISGIFSKKLALYQSQHIFTYGKYNDYATNFAEVVRWHRHVTEAIYLRRNLPRKLY